MLINLSRFRQYVVAAVLTIMPLAAKGITGMLYEYDKLTNSLVTQLCQDKYGYVWIASDFGLNRFDGYHFVNYYHSCRDSLSIPYNLVRSLLSTKDGDMFIGTGKGLARYDYTTDKFHRFQFPGDINPRVNSMVERVDADSEYIGGMVYEMKQGVVDMDARHYYAATSADGYEWKVIPHLGKTSSAITLLPQLAPVEGASLAYRFKGAGNVQKMKVRVVFSTVMPFVKGGHSVELGFTGCESKTVNLNKDMNWQHCYDLMYPAGAARVIEIENELPVKITAGGVYEFNLKPLAPGLVIQRIIISKNL